MLSPDSNFGVPFSYGLHDDNALLLTTEFSRFIMPFLSHSLRVLPPFCSTTEALSAGSGHEYHSNFELISDRSASAPQLQDVECD